MTAFRYFASLQASHLRGLLRLLLRKSSSLRSSGNLITFGDRRISVRILVAVAPADVGEDTGILRGTIRLSYLDAKTGVLKTRQMTLTGLTDNGDAVGTLSVKGKEPQTFQAVVE